MPRIQKDEITYIEQMSKQIISVLKEINEKSKDNEHIYQSPARAKFDRLRVELGKQLMEVRKRIYK